MIMEIFNLNGYGFFVWPAFIFTFVSFFYLYIKTKKEYLEQENIFLKEFNQTTIEKIEIVKTKNLEKPVLSSNII